MFRMTSSLIFLKVGSFLRFVSSSGFAILAMTLSKMAISDFVIPPFLLSNVFKISLMVFKEERDFEKISLSVGGGGITLAVLDSEKWYTGILRIREKFWVKTGME